MTDIAVKIRFANLDRMEKSFATASAKFNRAIAQGLNEGGDRVRTQFQRGLWKQTGAKNYRSITSRVRTIRAHSGGLAYQIIGTGKGLPIKEFPVATAGGHVQAMPWGVAHLFKRSFFIRGSLALPRARLGPGHDAKVRSLYGPSIPKEMGHGGMPALFYSAAATYVPPAIVKRLARAFA
jgi:hypothetical protein